MLTIRQSQMEAFRQQPRFEFEQSMARYLRRYFPAEAAAADLDRWVSSGLDAAARYGFLTEYESALYLSLMAMLGAGFLDDPATPWARPIVCDGATPSLDRIHRLYDRAVQFLEETCGPQGVWFDRALTRLRRYDMRPFEQPIHPRAVEGTIVRELTRLYPQKAAAIGVKAHRALIRMAIQQQPSAGIRDRFHHAALMFYLGAGYKADPCFPWAAERNSTTGRLI